MFHARRKRKGSDTPKLVPTPKLVDRPFFPCAHMAQYLCREVKQNTLYDTHHQESGISKEITKVLYNFLVAPFEPAASDSGHCIQGVDTCKCGRLPYRAPVYSLYSRQCRRHQRCIHEGLEAESGVSRLPPEHEHIYIYCLYHVTHHDTMLEKGLLDNPRSNVAHLGLYSGLISF